LRQNRGKVTDEEGAMKFFKGLLALLFVGVVAGFVLSLITPQLDLSGADIGTEEDEEF
jgi:hypothetical protein